MSATGGGSSHQNPTAFERIPPGSSWLQALVLLAAACMLAALAMWNGLPFLYPDTPTYLRGAEMGATKIAGEGRLPPWLPAEPSTGPAAIGESQDIEPSGSITSLSDKVVLAGRSVYYGALLYLSFLAGSLWLAVLAQGLCVAYVLHLLVVRIWGLREVTFLAGVAVLAVVTPLAAFTGLLMPDVFAGLAVLCIATLGVYWSRLDRTSRWLLAALLWFALASHSSHVAIAASLLVLALGLRAWGRWPSLSLRGMGVVAACLAGALLAEAAFNRAVTLAVGAPPLRLPHLTARLVDMGPGTDYLRRQCPSTPYATCAYLANYPTTWDAFLFSREPGKGAFALADAAGKRRMSEEQLRLALGVLQHAPVDVISGIAHDVVRQLGLFQVDVAFVRTDLLAAYAGRVPDAMFDALKRARTLDNDAVIRLLTALTHASVLASLLLAAAVAWRRWRPRAAAAAVSSPGGFDDFAAVVVAGVVVNAVVCGALAGALERFQSRVIWLVPFVALAWLALAMQRRRSLAALTANTPDTPDTSNAPGAADATHSIPSFERPTP
jgi:hypothetical protein